MPFFPASRAVLVGLLALLGGCPKLRQARAPTSPPCPAEAPAPPVLPFHHPLHDLADFWLQRVEDPDAVVLDADGIVAHNRAVGALRKDGLPVGRWDLLEPPVDPERLRGKWQADLEALRGVVAQGKRVLPGGGSAGGMLQQIERRIESAQPTDELRAVHTTAPLRCYPVDDGLYEEAWQLAFDMVQCAQLRVGEPVRVLGRSGDHLYVWSSYAPGWVRAAALTPRLDEAQARRYLEPERFVVVQRDRLALWREAEGGGLRAMAQLGAIFPLVQGAASGPLQVTVPTPAGLGTAWVREAGGVSVGFPPLTKRAVLRHAFALLNSPYGWGGVGATRDCSRFMMDLFGSFGLELPRNSWQQSRAGTRHVEVAELDEGQKAEAIEQAARRAIVLLYMPGHIMLYLGRDDEHLYALHQFSGYLVPCPNPPGGETMMRVNRAVVTSLELGRGSSRRAFIERITQLVLLEPPPVPASAPAAAAP
jgi:hypothetical protein